MARVLIPKNEDSHNIELPKMIPFENIVEDNYQAVKDRGLINDETDFYDFMEKLEEESKELASEWNSYKYVPREKGYDHRFNKECFESELIDCLSVLLNMARHYNIDVIEGLKANIIKNQERAKNNQ